MEPSIVLIAAAAVAVIGFVLYLRNRKSKEEHISPQVALNRKLGLPDDFQPQQYLGPCRPEDSEVVSPKGIKIFTCGFEREDIPLMKDGIKARVIPEVIDTIWADVRHKLLITSEQRFATLTPEQRAAIVALPDSLPSVKIEPSIWFEVYTNFGPTYVGGLTHIYAAQVAVWYILGSGAKVNWESYLKWEFMNVAMYAVGRPDLIL